MLQILVRLLILALSLTVVLSCSKTPSKSLTPQGGQDVGGGDTLGSSEEEVRFAVQSAVVLIQDIYGQENDNPLRKIVRDLIGTDLEGIAQKVFFMSGWEAHDQVNTEEFQTPEDFHNQKFKKGNLVWKEKGSCLADGSRHTDAAVSAHQQGADVCLSLENLMKIPRESLLKEVLCLLIHESAHLEGYREADALRLQKKICDELIKVQTFYDIQSESKKIKTHLNHALISVKKIKSLVAENKKHPRVVPLAFEAINSLTLKMPFFNNFGLFSGAIGAKIWDLGQAMASARLASSTLYFHFSGNGKEPGEPKSSFFNDHDMRETVRAEMLNGSIADSLVEVENIIAAGLNSVERNFPEVVFVRSSVGPVQEKIEIARTALMNAVQVFQKDHILVDIHSPIGEITNELSSLVLDSKEKIFFPNQQIRQSYVTKPLYGELRSKKIDIIGNFIFKSTIRLLESGTCPTQIKNLSVGSELCVELEKLSQIPQPDQFKESIALIVDLAAQLKGFSSMDRSKIQVELNRKLKKYTMHLDSNQTAKLVRNNLKFAIQKLEQSEQQLFQADGREKVTPLIEEAVLKLTYEMPDFMYPHFFQGSVGPSYGQFKQVLQLSRLTWLHLYFAFLEDTLNQDDGHVLRSDQFFNKYGDHAGVVDFRLTTYDAFEKSKALLQSALQELDKNFPEK